MKAPKRDRGFDLEVAALHLTKCDRKLGAWIKRIGPLEQSGWQKPFDPIDSLARSIIYQQLSGKAAATIVGRVEVALASEKLTSSALANVDDATLRSCGVSGNKLLALRDLSARDVNGELPSFRELSFLSDEEIIKRLTTVRGIGRWTVEMLLMFKLGRPDVLPIDDLGVRKGAQILDKQDVMPTPKELAVRGQCWGPYRTLAGLYLWRIVDAAAPPKAAPSKSLSKTAAKLPIKRSQG